MSKVLHEPAFVLHHYDWSESSCILELFTQNHGRVAVVAKGAKKPTSHLRAVLLPMQPIAVSYAMGSSPIQTLKSAQWLGGHAMPSGATLLLGFYVNELVLRLLPREDAHPLLWQCYATVMRLLSWEQSGNREAAAHLAALRAFELTFLRQMGWLPNLQVLTPTQLALGPALPYVLEAEVGLRAWGPAHAQEGALLGQDWCGLEEGLGAGFEGLLLQVQRICTSPKQAAMLRKLLRDLLQYHHGHALKTPQLLNGLKKWL